MFSDVLVLSQSPIQFDAVKTVVATVARETNIFTTPNTIRAVEGAKCNCPQPVGETSARACISAQIFPLLNASENPKTLIVAIQEYIHSQGGVWYNRCLVMLFYQGGSVCDEAMTDIEVPEAFEPKDEPDIRDHPRLGYSESIGERAHKQFERIPKDDWFKAASSTNPTRFEITCDAFSRVLKQLIAPQQYLATVPSLNAAVHGCDMKPLLLADNGCKTLSQCMVNQVNAHVGPVRLEKGDPLGAPSMFAEKNWRDAHFVYGVGSRGIVAATILATRLGMILVTEEVDVKHILPQNCILVTFDFSTHICSQIVNAWKSVLACSKSVVLVLALFDAPNLRKNYTERVLASLTTAEEEEEEKEEKHVAKKGRKTGTAASTTTVKLNSLTPPPVAFALSAIEFSQKTL